MENVKGTKRKHRYIPQQRAKKLKKEWVIRRKIKSKWKSQKHREGIPSQPHMSTQTFEERNASMGDEDHIQGSSDNEQEPSVSVQQDQETPREQKKDVPSVGSSLRELQKQAYSPASLHRHKSRPLRHPKTRTANEISSRSREASTSGPKHARGRGQPDMRLRMIATLEKIKRDYS